MDLVVAHRCPALKRNCALGLHGCPNLLGPQPISEVTELSTKFAMRFELGDPPSAVAERTHPRGRVRAEHHGEQRTIAPDATHTRIACRVVKNSWSCCWSMAFRACAVWGDMSPVTGMLYWGAYVIPPQRHRLLLHPRQRERQ